MINKKKSTVNIGETQQLSATVYPERAQSSKYLSLEWGVATVNSETGETEYQWATAPYQETDENGNLLTDESGNPVMNDGSVSDGIGKSIRTAFTPPLRAAQAALPAWLKPAILW